MMQSEKSQAKIHINPEVGVFNKREVARSNEKELECEICCELIPEYQMAKLFHCEHMFCEECLMSYLMLKISRSEQIRCFGPECSGELDEGSAIIASLTSSELKKYKKIKFKSLIRQKKDLRLCPGQNCEEGVINMTKLKNGKGKCSSCLSQYCMKCMEKHSGSVCKRKETNQIKKIFNLRQCKKFLSLIQRIQGCHHMKCKCGFQFCYICGQEWSQQHLCSILPAERDICTKIWRKVGECFCFQLIHLQNQDLSFLESVGRTMQIILLGIVSFFFILLWILASLVYYPLFFVILFAIQLFKSNIILLYILCCQSSSKQAIIGLLLYFIFLPFTLIIATIGGLFYDLSENPNQRLRKMLFLMFQL